MCLCACSDPHLVLLNWSTLFHMPCSYSQSCCICVCIILMGFPGGSEGKESACNAGDLSSIPGWEDPLEKGMATHSSILPWRIPWTEEPGRLQSMGLQRMGCNWSDWARSPNSRTWLSDWPLLSSFFFFFNSFLGPLRQELTRYDVFWINFNFLYLFNSLLVFVFLLSPYLEISSKLFLNHKFLSFFKFKKFYCSLEVTFYTVFHFHFYGFYIFSHLLEFTDYGEALDFIVS